MPAKRKKKAKGKAESTAAEGFVILLDDPAESTADEKPEGSANVVKLRRDCTIEEIDGIRQRLLTALEQESEMVVDLGGVKGADCAFLQLLCALRLEADARKKTISLRGQSDMFLEWAGLLGLTEQLS